MILSLFLDCSHILYLSRSLGLICEEAKSGRVKVRLWSLADCRVLVDLHQGSSKSRKNNWISIILVSTV